MPFAAILGVSLAAGIAATAWVALTLAEIGRFAAPLPLLAFPAAVLLTYHFLSRGRTAGESPRIAPQDLIAVGIACATLLLSFPPDEILVGGQDPGVYVHVAASVSRTGGLLISDPDVAAFTEEERGLVARNFAGIVLPFAGMWQLPDGRTSPQFFHLYPSLMAVAWAIGGVRAALLVNPLLNVAAVLALYALAAQLLGRRWALAAALVQALSCAQIRQAKFPTAEMMTQFLLLAGVALLARAMREDSPPPLLAPLAGAFLGLAVLARYDSIVFLALLFPVLVLGMASAGRTSPVLAALGICAVPLVQSWFHQRFITPHYLPLDGLIGQLLLAVAALLSALLLARRTRPGRHLAEAVMRRERTLRVVAAALVGAWVLFGWFVRPHLAGAGRVGNLFRLVVGDPLGSKLAYLLSGPESANMLFLADLLGALGMLVALAGIMVLIVSRRGLWETSWVAASAAMLVAVTLDVHHDHFLMWVSRRFIPVVVPLASVGIAAAAAAVAGARRGRSPALTGTALALVAAVLLFNAGPTLAMARGREWPGLIAWYEQFEKAVPAGADLYCDQPGFAAPLRYISGHRAYELSARDPGRIGRLVSLMRRKAAAGREVLYLSQQPFDEPRAAGLVPLGSYPLRSSMLANSRRGVPTQTKARGADFVLFRVVPSRGDEEALR